MSNHNDIKSILSSYCNTNWGKECYEFSKRHPELSEELKPLFSTIVSAFIVNEHHKECIDRDNELKNLPSSLNKVNNSNGVQWFSPYKNNKTKSRLNLEHTNSNNNNKPLSTNNIDNDKSFNENEIVLNEPKCKCIAPYGTFNLKISKDKHIIFDPTSSKQQQVYIDFTNIKKLYKFILPKKKDILLCIQLNEPIEYGKNLLRFVLTSWKQDKNIHFIDKNIKLSSNIGWSVVSHILLDSSKDDGRLSIEEGSKAIQCYQGAREGVLYVLNSGLFHLTKPLIYIQKIVLTSYSVQPRGSDACDITIKYDDNNSKASFDMVRSNDITYLKSICDQWISENQRTNKNDEDEDTEPSDLDFVANDSDESLSDDNSNEDDEVNSDENEDKSDENEDNSDDNESNNNSDSSDSDEQSYSDSENEDYADDSDDFSYDESEILPRFRSSTRNRLQTSQPQTSQSKPKKRKIVKVSINKSKPKTSIINGDKQIINSKSTKLSTAATTSGTNSNKVSKVNINKQPNTIDTNSTTKNDNISSKQLKTDTLVTKKRTNVFSSGNATKKLKKKQVSSGNSAMMRAFFHVE